MGGSPLVIHGPLVLFGSLSIMILLSLGRSFDWTMSSLQCLTGPSSSDYDRMVDGGGRVMMMRNVDVDSDRGKDEDRDKDKEEEEADLPPYDGPQTIWAMNRSLPCEPSESIWYKQDLQRSPAKTGILYVRELKTGSSTLGSILLRLAFRRGEAILPDNAEYRMKKGNSSDETSEQEEEKKEKKKREKQEKKKREKQEKKKREKDDDDDDDEGDDEEEEEEEEDYDDDDEEEEDEEEPLPCRHRLDHGSAREKGYRKRNPEKSFLVSMLRDPKKRSISQFFHFRVSENNEVPSDENFKDFFVRQSDVLSGYYAKDLVMEKSHLDLKNHPRTVRKILESYDFIAVTERLDESLVVMKMILNLTYSDILYVSSKKSGAFSTGHPHRHPCIYMIPAFITEGMEEFFASRYFTKYMELDNLLYRAVNKSLDNTIDALGRDRFVRQLRDFRTVLSASRELCEHVMTSRCDESGHYHGAETTNCILWDLGCGYKCLNRVPVEKILKGEKVSKIEGAKNDHHQLTSNLSRKSSS